MRDRLALLIATALDQIIKVYYPKGYRFSRGGPDLANSSAFGKSWWECIFRRPQRGFASCRGVTPRHVQRNLDNRSWIGKTPHGKWLVQK